MTRTASQTKAPNRSTEQPWSTAPAAAADAPEIGALLRAASLPYDDFSGHLARFLVARDGNRIVGAIGAEVYGADALLRSLVVDPLHRGAGLGGRLVQELDRVGAGWGIKRWWLLTTTAEAFFAARGFRVMPRSAAPAAIASTAEFRELCPSAAVCMMRQRKGAA